MKNGFSHAQQGVVGCLIMASCSFFLLMNQTQIKANTTAATTATSQTQTVNASATGQQLAFDSKGNPSYNATDQGNYGCLDQVKFNDGQLSVSGWHATNRAQGRPYHYIIAYDRTNSRELSRVNVTSQPTERADVATVHNVYGAKESGFRTSFNLGPAAATTGEVQIISRYTDDQNGNGNAADYWFAPVTVNRGNYAHLDQVTVNNNELQLAGWHATNLAADKPYHYLIMIDRTNNNREVGRVLVDQPVKRPDVAAAYPDVEGAGKSGFSANISLQGLNLSHQLQVISRYSGAKNGNSDYVDFWFSPITKENEANQGCLDSYNLNSGKTMTVSGWHANDLAQIESHHFIILFDQTANRQVSQTAAQQVERLDVASAFPQITQARHAGFTAVFDLSSTRLTAGHVYRVISRYSTSNTGNGDQGQFVDYWYAPIKLDQRGGACLDTVQMTSDGLKVAGWMASDQSLDRPYAYLIVLNNGQEISRTRLNLQARGDVARKYGQVYNSQNSGFSTLLKLDPQSVTGQLGIILRFSGKPDGNRDYVDLLSQSFASNDGYFDNINVSPNSIYIRGWHASNQSADKPYQWLIFVNQDGHELYRQQVLDINNPRPDLAQNRSFIFGAGRAGFKLAFAIPQALQHHVVRVIHRLTNDPQGNGNYVDWWSGPVDINAYQQRLISQWQQVANRFANPVSIAIQVAQTGEVITYTNVPGQNFVTASTVKVGILAKLLHNQGGNLSAAQQGVASRMIRFSDNDCATELYNEIGAENGLNQLFQELGMNSSHCNGHWAFTTTTATDQLCLLHEIFLNPRSSYLNQQSQQYIQKLMGQVTPSQAWGISAGSSHFYIKDGWNTSNGWNVSSIGAIPGKYTIAVYTVAPSFDRCRSYVEQLALATRQVIS